MSSPPGINFTDARKRSLRIFPASHVSPKIDRAPFLYLESGVTSKFFPPVRNVSLQAAPERVCDVFSPLAVPPPQSHISLLLF